MDITFWIAVYPGISAVALGFLGAIPALRPADKPFGPVVRALLVSVMVGLAVTAIGATLWQQKILSDKEVRQRDAEAGRDRAIAFMRGQVNALVRHGSPREETKRLELITKMLQGQPGQRFEALERELASLEAGRARKTKVKADALALANTLVSWLTERGFNKHEDWMSEHQRSPEAVAVMEEYRRVFEPAVFEIKRELTANGAPEYDFVNFVWELKNGTPTGVLALVQRIRELADSLD